MYINIISCLWPKSSCQYHGLYGYFEPQEEALLRTQSGLEQRTRTLIYFPANFPKCTSSKLDGDNISHSCHDREFEGHTRRYWALIVETAVQHMLLVLLRLAASTRQASFCAGRPHAFSASKPVALPRPGAQHRASRLLPHSHLFYAEETEVVEAVEGA
jgi:hypothetical protein